MAGTVSGRVPPQEAESKREMPRRTLKAADGIPAISGRAPCRARSICSISSKASRTTPSCCSIPRDTVRQLERRRGAESRATKTARSSGSTSPSSTRGRLSRKACPSAGLPSRRAGVGSPTKAGGSGRTHAILGQHRSHGDPGPGRRSASVLQDHPGLTERRLAEEALRLSEERFRLLVDGVLDYAIFMLTPEGNVASWNRGAERMKGYAASEILGRHFSTFYPDYDLAKGKPEWELRQAIEHGRVEDEGWRIRKDGGRFWADVVITALRDKEGRLQGFTKVTRDLTQRRRIEELHKPITRRTSFWRCCLDELRNPLAPCAPLFTSSRRRRRRPKTWRRRAASPRTRSVTCQGCWRT